MDSSQASSATKYRVGIFTVLALALVGGITVYVNDRPFWWRTCQLVHINVEDAAGLKSKSPIKSLGIEIGYLKTVELADTYVNLGICITAQVEILPTTRAYIRSEGFLGDKYVELKPVKYTGPKDPMEGIPATRESFLNFLVPSVYAAEALAAPQKPATPPVRGQREIPVGESSQDVQHLVNKVDSLVHEITGLTNNLKEAINPDELRSTMKQLNRTLENASKTLAPEGGLNQTAQRTLAKLEDAIEQLRDIIGRVNKGEGSVGMMLNDPSYADEVREAIRNVNRLLGRVSGLRFVVDIGGESVRGYDSSRAWFRLGVWPRADRYYLIGIGVDPRGKRTSVTTTTTAGNQTTVSQTVQNEETGLVITAMIGKVFWRRLDLAIGALHGDGAISVGLWLGPHDNEDLLRVTNDIYARAGGGGVDDRLSVILRPFPKIGIYARGGMESFRKINGLTQFSYGAGISFDDDDIKMMFAFLR